MLIVNEKCTTVSLLKFYFLQVDKHIRRLDTDLARFEADLKEKQIESTDYDSTSSKGKKGVCPLYLLHMFFFWEVGNQKRKTMVGQKPDNSSPIIEIVQKKYDEDSTKPPELWVNI